MNKKKKALRIIAAALLALTLAFGISASAESEDVKEDIENAETVTEEVKEDIENAEDENIFAEIYGAARTHADKIFSLLAFLGTLIVGYAYKKGLIPLLSEAIEKIKGGLEKLKSDTEEHDAKIDERIDGVTRCVECVEKTLGECTETLTRLDGELSGYGDIVKDHETMRTLFSYQIDMLYAIFMSSALPQYQKDEIGEKIATMREELAAYENKDE